MSASPGSSLYLPHMVEMPEFHESVDQEKYKCVKCLKTLRPPVKQTQCGHRLCSICLEDLRSSGHTMCPGQDEDEECVDLANDSVVGPDFGTDRDLKKLPVYCDNRQYGCTATTQWAKKMKHLEECQFKPVPCPNAEKGCEEKGTQAQIDQHLQSCNFILKKCNICRVDVPVHQLKKHEEECQRKPQPCQVKGCNFSGPVKKLQEHTHDPNVMCEHILLLQDQVKDKDNKIAAQEEQIKQLQGHVKEGGAEAGGSKMKTHMLKTQAKTNERLIKVERENADTAQLCKNQSDKLAQLQDVSKMHESRITQLESGAGKSGSGSAGVAGDAGPSTHLKDSESIHYQVNMAGKRKGVHPFQHKTDPMSDEDKRKLRAVEASVGMHDIRLAEYDLRFQCMEAAGYDGVLIWKIKDFQRRKNDAVSGRTLSLYSQPFYTSRFGYKMCARVYLNGDGMGKGSHMSLFFVVMKGDYDTLLPWPFRQKVSLTLLDQEGGRKPLTDTFRPDPTSTSFRQPMGDMNIASGCPLFVAQSTLETRTYLKDDTIFIKVTVDTSDLPPI